MLANTRQLVRAGRALKFYNLHALQRALHAPVPRIYLRVPTARVMEIASKQYSQDASCPATADFEYVRKATQDNNIYIIDVREPDEIKEHGKIPNSINIPLGSVVSTLSVSEEEFEKLYNRPKPNVDSEMIFHCMIGRRAGMAQQDAINLGFKKTRNYIGSWNDWVQQKSKYNIHNDSLQG